jgi:uncharacterized protein YjaG (DUF416 family)
VTLPFDEPVLVARLAQAPDRARALFAASIAERLLPLYDAYGESAGRGETALVRAGLEAAWQAATGDVAAPELEAWQTRVEALVPDDHDAGVTAETAYCENAAAAVAYALRAAAAVDDPREPAWAALQLYEAADYAAQQQLADLDLNRPGAEDELAATPVVRAALQAVEDDLAAATGAVRDDADVARLRRDARDGGLRFLLAVLRPTAADASAASASPATELLATYRVRYERWRETGIPPSAGFPAFVTALEHAGEREVVVASHGTPDRELVLLLSSDKTDLLAYLAIERP